jgi:hypothetical protein
MRCLLVFLLWNAYYVFLSATQNKVAEPTILMKTTGDDIHLRFPDLETLKLWLFGFQKSVALVLIHILEARNAALNARTATERDESLFGKPLAHLESGYGHGDYSNAAVRHSNSNSTGGHYGSLQDTSFLSNFNGSEWQRARGGLSPQASPNKPFGNVSSTASIPMAVPTVSREGKGTSVARDTSGVRLGVSPAIPIGSHFSQFPIPEDEDDDLGEYRERVASSYHDIDQGLSPMQNFLHQDADYDDEDDDEEPDHITVSTQDPDTESIDGG